MSAPPTTLRAGGVCLALDTSGSGLPRILHWGDDLPERALEQLAEVTPGPVPHSALDEPWPLTVLPTQADGWRGTPALEVHRGGGSAAPRFRAESGSAVEPSGSTADGGSVTTRASDARHGIDVTVIHRLDPSGVVRVSLSVANSAEDGEVALDVGAVRALMPLPTRASEVLDLTGRWCRERAPQRGHLQDGVHLRAARRGRTGHDATLVLCAGTPGFGFRSGEVWGVHVAWSGNHEHLLERLPEGAGMHAAVIGGGELLDVGEIRLAPGETYTAPDVVFVHSSEGLDGLTRHVVTAQRAAPAYRTSPRPLVLNTWEAVYFDQDLPTLTRLADTAREIGVERFVLDDGWFGGRRHDRAGLGDWWVSPEVWPQGLEPLAEHVHGLGMEFGLWFEPEMVNLDSDIVREHPDWVLGPQDGPPRPWRFQQTLDVANPDARAHLRERISELVTRLGIDFIKWDHNRDLLEAVRTAPGGGASDRPAVHAQTTAFYTLLDELRSRHPDLEIESCASGGARVDLGVLARTDRIWASDNNDALERTAIQRWTGLLVPPERIGSHIGPPTAHTTHRTLDLPFRALVALQGHPGLEWDITTCSPDELDALRAWSRLYREVRDLLHTGDVVRADLPEDLGLIVDGRVRADREEAVFFVVCDRTGRAAAPGLIPLPGLDPDRMYQVRVRTEVGEPATIQTRPPDWWTSAATPTGVHVDGALLGAVGLPVPVLAPAQGFLLHLT